MAETLEIATRVIPGTYIGVRADALIGAAPVSTGNIGIVGTAATGANATHNISDYPTALELFGPSNDDGTLNLTRSIQLAYRNGARIVYAIALPAGADEDAFSLAFGELAKEDVNILIAPELSTTLAKNVLIPIVNSAETNGKDMMVVIGCDATAVPDMVAQVTADKRVVMAAPGIRLSDDVTLNGSYTAAAIAGLLSTLRPQSSPTNKVLPGVGALSQNFAYGETRQLVHVG